MKSLAGALLAALVLSSNLRPPSVAPSQMDVAPGTVTVTGEAEVLIVPDEVIITLGVETWDVNLNAARRENDGILREVVRVAKDHGIDAQHVKMDYMSIEPRYNDDYEKRGFIGFFVRKTVVVTLRDLGEFEDFMVDVLGAGVNYVHGIDFRTTELRSYRDTARSLAIRAAKEKAAALAGELGKKLGEPRTIEEHPYGYWSWYQYGWWGSRYGSTSQNVVQNMGGEPVLPDSSMAPGQISVRAQVSVTFELR